MLTRDAASTVAWNTKLTSRNACARLRSRRKMADMGTVKGTIHLLGVGEGQFHVVFVSGEGTGGYPFHLGEEPNTSSSIHWPKS